jgi:hypothetical protein
LVGKKKRKLKSLGVPWGAMALPLHHAKPGFPFLSSISHRTDFLCLSRPLDFHHLSYIKLPIFDLMKSAREAIILNIKLRFYQTLKFVFKDYILKL